MNNDNVVKVQDNKYKLVRDWILKNMPLYDYVNAFDMAVDCATDLNLCEMCEETGDCTLVPEYIITIADLFMPKVS